MPIFSLLLTCFFDIIYVFGVNMRDIKEIIANNKGDMIKKYSRDLGGDFWVLFKNVK